jgi:hypothetical protein
MVPFLPSGLQYTAYGVTGVLASIQFICAVYAMTVDVQDPLVKQSNVPRNVKYVKFTGVTTYNTGSSN